MARVTREFETTIDGLKIDGVIEIEFTPGYGNGPDTEDSRVTGHEVKEIWCGENTAWNLEVEAVKALDLRKLLHGI